ncbi:MAG: hypothetical protein AAF674_11205, partial [Pseudomonadota bacterium]
VSTSRKVMVEVKVPFAAVNITWASATAPSPPTMTGSSTGTTCSFRPSMSGATGRSQTPR